MPMIPSNLKMAVDCEILNTKEPNKLLPNFENQTDLNKPIKQKKGINKQEISIGSEISRNLKDYLQLDPVRSN